MKISAWSNLAGLNKNSITRPAMHHHVIPNSNHTAEQDAKYNQCFTWRPRLIETAVWKDKAFLLRHENIDK